jgi:hypothetical protein
MSVPVKPVRVSVLMLAFNRPQYLGRAIQSVLGQTLQDWELVIVQDGSNAEVTKVLLDWAARDARIRYLHRTEVGNIANAYNFGLNHAEGDYIAILDDDDTWIQPDKLARQTAFLDEHPDYVGCGGGMIVVDHNGQEAMRYCKPERDGDIKRSALVANPMAHSTCMFRLLRQGLSRYDDSLAGFQDWDLWLKLGRYGKLYNFPEMFTCYALWEGGGSFQQQRANAKSAVRIVWRHRKSYPRLPSALALALMHYAYAHLPAFVRKSTFATLSRLKKKIFSKRRTAAGQTANTLPPA